MQHAGIDPFSCGREELLHYVAEQNLPAYPSFEGESIDSLLNFILGMCIEPKLGFGELIVLAYYPASQAALAKTVLFAEGLVAERFEIYCRGVELANGYHELVCAREQRQRLEGENSRRSQLGKAELPLDEAFLAALQSGVPSCCGVAVGVDRLMMLKHNAPHIAEVMPFGWHEA
jgi:lysyl-tRNA synthetase class 2